MNHNIGVTGKTTMGTGAYYAPYQPLLNLDKNIMFYNKAVWKLSFAFLPRRCAISNKRIWLKYGYEGIATTYYRGTADTETRWHDKIEHIIFQLKR
jgi:hypothetical protein